jgi:hypothetical protein
MRCRDERMSSKRQCHEVPNHRRNREENLFLFFLRKSENFGKSRSSSVNNDAGTSHNSTRTARIGGSP